MIPPQAGPGARRVGVLGGSFDPIHLGHLRAAEELAGLAALDLVVLVPCSRNPLRPGPPGAAAADRLAMVRLAAAGNPRLLVSDLEVRRGGVSYTVDTLDGLSRKMAEDRLVLAMGADAWAGFGSWREPERVAALADLVVLARPGSPAPGGDLLAPLPPALRDAYRPQGRGYVHASGRTLAAAEVTALDISGSRIRALAASGASIRYLVPDAVLEHIQSHGLYRGPAGEGKER